jgi:hypothetical protein
MRVIGECFSCLVLNMLLNLDHTAIQEVYTNLHLLSPSTFLGSSDFPVFDSQRDGSPSFSDFEDIFVKYSSLALTKETDRPVAIAGLEYRLAKFHKTRSIYGIVKLFFPKSLLWYRCKILSADDAEASHGPMKPLIDFKNEVLSWSIEREKVPLWSWMAYTGEISYGVIPTEDLHWRADVKLCFTENRCALDAPLARILPRCRIEPYEDSNCKINCKISCEVTKCNIEHENKELVSWIRYDEDGHGDEAIIESLGCITLAQGADLKTYADVSWDDELVGGKFNYILVVTPTSPGEIREKKCYRRLGVAIVQSEHLFHEENNVLVF